MRHHFFKRISIFITSVIMLLLPVNTVFANNDISQSVVQPNIAATSGIAIDAKTGQLLYAKNPDKSMPLASMSKLLSMYVILGAIKSGKLKMNQKLTIPSDVHNLSVDHEYANVPLALHKKFTVAQLYQASFESANAAIMMLAKQVGGTTQNFVKMERQAAKKLGLKKASIYTPCGLTNGEVGSMGMPNTPSNYENKMSARDMAILARKLIQKYPRILRATSVPSYTLGGTTIKNGDYMLKGGTQASADLPVQGMKTGTSDTCGGSFTGTTNKDGHRIITVVLHASNKEPTDPGRFIQTKKIMYYVYNHYQYVKAGNRDNELSKVDVPSGKKTSVQLAAKNSLYYWIPRDGHQEAPKLFFQNRFKDGKGLVAPLKDHQFVGIVKIPGIYNVYDKPLSSPVVTTSAVSEAGFFTKIFRAIKNIF